MADDVDRVKQIAFSSLKSIRINIHLPVQTGDRVKRLVTLRFWSLSIFARFPWRIHQILKFFFQIPAQLTLPCITSLFSARVRERKYKRLTSEQPNIFNSCHSGVVDYKAPLQMSISHLAYGLGCPSQAIRPNAGRACLCFSVPIGMLGLASNIVE